MSKIKAFVFDFDGTLSYTDEFIVRTMMEAFKNILNKDLTVEEIINNYGPSEEGVILNILDKDEEKAKLVFDEYLKLYKVNHDKYDKEIDPIFYEIFENIKRNNFKLIVLTGRSEKTLNISLDQFKIRKYIDSYYFGSVLGVNKPDSFKKLEEDNKISNDEIVYFGDSKNDIKSCLEAKVKLYSVTYYNKNQEEEIKKLNPNVITSLDELKEVVDKLISENK